MAHILAQESFDGGVSIAEFNGIVSNILRYSRVIRLNGDTIPVVSFRTIVTVETKQVLKGIFMARSNGVA
jgi:hypothetical protein